MLPLLSSISFTRSVSNTQLEDNMEDIETREKAEKNTTTGRKPSKQQVLLCKFLEVLHQFVPCSLQEGLKL